MREKEAEGAGSMKQNWALLWEMESHFPILHETRYVDQIKASLHKKG
jgi:hypothetical protein